MPPKKPIRRKILGFKGIQGLRNLVNNIPGDMSLTVRETNYLRRQVAKIGSPEMLKKFDENIKEMARRANFGQQR